MPAALALSMSCFSSRMWTIRIKEVDLLHQIHANVSFSSSCELIGIPANHSSYSQFLSYEASTAYSSRTTSKPNMKFFVVVVVDLTVDNGLAT